MRIITKIMANHFNWVLQPVISDSQSTFIPRRMIFDNFMTVFENFHYMKTKKNGRKGTLKLDMTKTFDKLFFSGKCPLQTGFSPYLGRIGYDVGYHRFVFYLD